jgi:hypothetical protein
LDSYEKEARQVVYRLKCSDRLRSSKTGHTLVYDKMIEKSPIIAAKTDIIIHTNVFDRRFLVKFPLDQTDQMENVTISATQLLHRWLLQ